MSGVTVTVAVVVKDRVDLMRRCLVALDRLDPAPDEVVLVDNGSTDGTWELVAAHRHPSAPTIARQVGGPVGAARNVALAAATSDVIAYTDSDCEPDPAWLTALIAPFSDPDVDVVQGRTVPREPVTAPWPATQDIGAWTDLYEACNIAYRRAELAEAGGFGEDIGFFGEDTVAGWRVRRRGGSGVFAPDAVVAHAVSHPGFRWHLARAGRYSNLPSIVGQFPEMRAEVLYRRFFLRRRNAALVAALGGVLAAAATRRGAPLLAAAPYLWWRRPERATPAALRIAAQGIAFDAAVEAALVRGNLRTRTLVL